MQTTPKQTMWTSEMDDKLRELVARRLPAREVAAAISDHFSLANPITKNSVIGRAHRIGVVLEKPTAARRPEKIKPPKEVPAPKIKAVKKPPPPKVYKKKEEATAKVSGVRIWELSLNQCRWTDSNGPASDFVFCAEATRPGLSYCPEHHAKAYRPLPPRK